MITSHLIRPVLLLILILPSLSAWGTADARYEEFARLAQSTRKKEALDLGRRLFETLAAQNPAPAALLSRRLEAAQQIDALVARAVQPSQARLLESMAVMDDLGPAPVAPRPREVPAALPPPAQDLYWTHVNVFTGEPARDGLSAPQAAFLDRYYDLQMQDSILKIGRRVLMADPNSSENACYAIVLPLLYLHGRDQAWDRIESFLALFSAPQLELGWRFALLQAERPRAAAQIARCQAQGIRREFSLEAWALTAADACVANHRPDLAQESLQIVLDGTRDRSKAVELQLKIAESHARCGDYAGAAQACNRIVQDRPDSPLYGRILATYFGYLARDAKADQVVAETEPALTDARCQPYLPQILYLRWWALCKTDRRDEAAQIAQRLLAQHPQNPCVAPVLLERATDALARQQYDGCRELLVRLTRDFPDTDAAKRGQEILIRLQATETQPGKDRLSEAGSGTTPRGR